MTYPGRQAGPDFIDLPAVNLIGLDQVASKGITLRGSDRAISYRVILKMVEVRTVNEIWQQYLVLLLKNTYEYITLQQAKVEIFIVYADFIYNLCGRRTRVFARC